MCRIYFFPLMSENLRKYKKLRFFGRQNLALTPMMEQTQGIWWDENNFQLFSILSRSQRKAGQYEHCLRNTKGLRLIVILTIYFDSINYLGTWQRSLPTDTRLSLPVTGK